MALGSDLITKIRFKIVDTDDVSFSVAELISYLNDGAKEFAATTGCLQDSGTIDTNGTASDFSLSSNLTNPHTIFNVLYAGLPISQTYRHAIISQWGASVSTPTEWYTYGDRIYFDFIPTTATGSNAVTCFHTRIPTDMTDENSTLDFPVEWEPAVVHYAISSCFEQQRDSVLAAIHQAKYDALQQSAFAINKAKLFGEIAA